MDIKLTPIYDSEGKLQYYDFSFTKGKLDVVDGIDEIKQRIIVNLQTYLGENFRDTSHGVDYFNNVFGREVTDTIPQDELKAAIIDTRGVTELKDFSFTRQPGSRTGDLNAQIITTQGELNLVTPIAL
jgi:hypothetical protein